MASNSNLHMSKAGKTDEFYTQLSTIEEELRHYRKYFKGKTVLCNCDDPYESNFFKYFALNFNALGLKKLITTCYKNQERDLFSQHDCERAIWLEYTGDRNGKVVFAAAVHLERPDSDPAVETGEKATLPADQILVVTAKGQLIRTSVGSIRETARGAKGVRIVNVAAGDAVVSATVVPDSGEDGASPSGLPDSPDSAEPAPPSPAERE